MFLSENKAKYDYLKKKVKWDGLVASSIELMVD